MSSTSPTLACARGCPALSSTATTALCNCGRTVSMTKGVPKLTTVDSSAFAPAPLRCTA